MWKADTKVINDMPTGIKFQNIYDLVVVDVVVVMAREKVFVDPFNLTVLGAIFGIEEAVSGGWPSLMRKMTAFRDSNA